MSADRPGAGARGGRGTLARLAPATRTAPRSPARRARRVPGSLTSGGRWGAVAVVLLAAVVGAHAEDEPPAPAPVEVESVLLAEVVSDPEGEATRRVEEAVQALLDDDPERTYAHLLALAESDPDVLVPVSVLTPGQRRAWVPPRAGCCISGRSEAVRAARAAGLAGAGSGDIRWHV